MNHQAVDGEGLYQTLFYMRSVITNICIHKGGPERCKRWVQASILSDACPISPARDCESLRELGFAVLVLDGAS